MTANPTLLRALVTERHLQRYDTFLLRFRQAARALSTMEGDPSLASATVGRRQYERWLSGNVRNRPHPDSCRVLEHMFSRTVDELFGPADAAGMPAERDNRPATAAMQVVPHVDAGAALSGGVPDDMERRALLRELGGSGGGAIAAPALEAIEAVRRSMDATLSDRGDAELLEEWEQRVDDYSNTYLVSAPVNLLGNVLLDFVDVQSALKLGQYGRQRVRLWRVSAQLAGMVGVILTVLGEHRDARAWFHTGSRAAGLADDGRLRAWMYTRAATVSLHFGTPSSALVLADKAAALHRGPSGAVVRTQLVRARALARMGDRVNAWSALRQARVAFESLDGNETSDKVFGHTERQFLAHSASAVTRLRDVKTATRLREEALAGFAGHGSTEPLSPALSRIEQGLCLLWESDPTQACRHVLDTLVTLPAEHRTELAHVYVRTFMSALTPEQRRLRSAVELEDFLQSAFSTTPAH